MKNSFIWYLLPSLPSECTNLSRRDKTKQQPAKLASKTCSLALLSGDHIPNPHLCTRVCRPALCHSLREYIQANSHSDKWGEGEAHWKLLVSLSLEDLGGLITYPGCAGGRGWMLTRSAQTRNLQFVCILLIPLLQHSFGSAWIHRNFCSFISLGTGLLVAKFHFVGPNLPLLECPGMRPQPCWLALSKTACAPHLHWAPFTAAPV